MKMELEQARREIAAIDEELAALFERRMHTAAEIAAWKAAHDLPVRDEAQEARVLERGATQIADPALREPYLALLREIMRLSRGYQQKLMNKTKRGMKA